MRYVNSGWLQVLTSASLNNGQRSLLERVLFALDGNGHLGQNVATLPNALVAMIRAQAALKSHGASNQPQYVLLGRVVDEAISCMDRAAPAYGLGGHADLASARAELIAVAGVITQQKKVAKQLRAAKGAVKQAAMQRAMQAAMQATTQATTQAATQLDRLLGPLTEAVKGWVEPLWTGVVGDRSLAEQATSEIAVVVALEGRDSTALYEDTLNLISAGAPSADAVRDVLWPPKRSHLVTLAVHGTRELRGLSTFVADCQQWKLWAGQTEDDLPRRRAIRKLARLMGPVEGSAVLVSSPTEAADPDTAVRIARRMLSEALDHYAAGDRLIDLHLDPAWATEVSTNQPTFGTVRTPGQRASYPLTGHMPASLRAAMRAANLARRVDAPMASAALSWSALESTELKPAEAKILASACALQTLRRHLASAHSLLIAGGRAHLEHQRHRVRMEQGQLRKHEKGARGCEQSDNPHAQVALITHLEQVEVFRTRVAHAEQELQTVEAAVNSDLAALGAYVQTEGTKERLTSFDVWLDVLLPTQTVSSPSLQAAQAAAISLAKRCGGLAAETFALWRSRLAAPQDLAIWLDRHAGTYRGVLEWLYATRNMVIHQGHFTAPSDELTAHAARGIVDMALEFLSNWHTVERARAVSETPAKAVYEHLGSRLTQLINELGSSGATCSPLRVDHITGPDSTWWVADSAATTP
ncbi:hypothetical protein [Streptomyces sp. NPDC048272]|uniref:hypothetical protein n=1 Tax=Streptomyces sp. NPDC048272 TaxID=3154616 RepID=UPI003440C23F